MSGEKRIAVLVSGGGTNLQALLDAEARGDLQPGKIAAVVASAPGVYALERAKQAGVPGYVMARKDYPSSKAYTIALTEFLQGQKIDLVILAGFMTILTEEMVKAFPNAILNVHPALIPSFCGAGYYGLHVHEAALSYGVKVSGAFAETCYGTGGVADFAPSGGAVLPGKAPGTRPRGAYYNRRINGGILDERFVHAFKK